MKKCSNITYFSVARATLHYFLITIFIYTLLVELEFIFFRVSQNFKNENIQVFSLPAYFAVLISATKWLSSSQEKIIYNSIITRSIISISYSQIWSEIQFIKAGLYLHVFHSLLFHSYTHSSMILIIPILELFWHRSFYNGPYNANMWQLPYDDFRERYPHYCARTVYI